MFWIKSSSTTSTAWCHKLNEDVLRLVIAQVDTLRGLSNLCQVSRQFYRLAVAQLYRDVNLKLSTPSHQRLLRRLASPKDRFSEHFRKFTFGGIEKCHLETVFDLSLVLTKLVNLEILICTGSVSFSRCIPNTLWNRHKDTGIGFEAAVLIPGVPQPLYTTLHGLSCPRLTHLHITLDNTNQIQDSFKSDLVHMLLQVRSLRGLELWIGAIMNREFPDLLSKVGYERLPKLEVLWLITGQNMEVFTARELWRWGAAGGWNDIHSLVLERPGDVRAFIGRVPKLKTLMYCPRKKEDIIEIESYLRDTECDAPFGQELDFIRISPWYTLTHLPIGLSNVVPSYLLRYAQNVTKLETHRPRFEGGLLPEHLCTITSDDIEQLRSLCPRLEELWVDVVYNPKSLAVTIRHLFPLAQIERLKKLRIYLHIDNPRSHRTGLSRRDCNIMFNSILRQRLSKQLPYKAPFAVYFKLVRVWNKIKDHHFIADYEFWMDKSGKTQCKERLHGISALSWEERKGDIRRDYYRVRDAVYRAFRGEVVT
jgi:hypothetical protein